MSNLIEIYLNFNLENVKSYIISVRFMPYFPLIMIIICVVTLAMDWNWEGGGGGGGRGGCGGVKVSHLPALKVHLGLSNWFTMNGG